MVNGQLARAAEIEAVREIVEMRIYETENSRSVLRREINASIQEVCKPMNCWFRSISYHSENDPHREVGVGFYRLFFLI